MLSELKAFFNLLKFSIPDKNSNLYLDNSEKENFKRKTPSMQCENTVVQAKHISIQMRF